MVWLVWCGLVSMVGVLVSGVVCCVLWRKGKVLVVVGLGVEWCGVCSMYYVHSIVGT